MKAASGPLTTALLTQQFLLRCQLYTFSLLSGTTLYYTDWGADIVYGGHTFKAAKLDSAPGFRIGKTTTAIGMQADSTDLTMTYDTNTRILGLTPGGFANSGALDGCVIKIDTLFMQTAGDTSLGVVNRYTGIVDEVSVSTAAVAITITSRIAMLATQFPRNKFVPQCNHALFDSGCTLNKASFAVNGTLTSVVGPTVFRAGALSFPDKYFAQGNIVWLTGPNAGQVSEVTSYVGAGGTYTVVYPLPALPTIGDTFTAYPGCAKTRAACGNNNPAIGPQFNNLLHFKGFPDVPTPETILMGSNAGSPGDNSGGNAGPGGMGVGRGPGGASGRPAQK